MCDFSGVDSVLNEALNKLDALINEYRNSENKYVTELTHDLKLFVYLSTCNNAGIDKIIGRSIAVPLSDFLDRLGIELPNGLTPNNIRWKLIAANRQNCISSTFYLASLFRKIDC